MRVLEAHCDDHEVHITWADRSATSLPTIWLRDNDPADLHPHTRERLFDLTTVSVDIEPSRVVVTDEGIVIRWPDLDRDSSYSADWLATHRPGRRRSDPADIAAEPWRAEDLDGIPRVDAARCAAHPESLLAALRVLKRSGLVIVEGLADHPEAGERFGDLIGFKRRTNFGVLFEVVSAARPNNLAYTSIELPLHTDLPNQELVPGAQFLHCIRNDATGGDSVFGDGYRVAADLRAESPSDFELLATTPVAWRFHDADHDLRSHRPIIGLDAGGNVGSLAFNAHIADVPDLPAHLLRPFYAAYQRLMRRIRSASYRVEHRLRPGEMVVFDNCRVLHGRRAFDPSTGGRHLRGYYIDHLEIDSRIRVLSRGPRERARLDAEEPRSETADDGDLR